MDIAVAGCGIAGATAAWQLATLGHNVTVFEQSPKCGPVGAGILLQPSGKAVLQSLGLLNDVASWSSRIDSLHARHANGSTLVHLKYERVSQSLFGLGVHRGRLFELLFSKCREAGVTIRENHRVTAYAKSGSKATLTIDGNADDDEYDLLIVADGSRSVLREQSGLTHSITEYPYAAIWAICPWSGDATCLQQIVGRDGQLLGILPVDDKHCSFFWGIDTVDWPETQQRGIDAFKQHVASFYPPAESIVNSLGSFDEVTFATYRNAQMKQAFDGPVVFIGDAAHATSPHLGQGLNLALVDAHVLVNQISTHNNVETAIANYARSRHSTTRFYATLTGLLTPFFQTSSRVLQLGRDIALPIMSRMPYVGSQMVITMSGLKTGWLSQDAP